MTREEAIAWLKDHHSIDLNTQDDEAHRMAIKALEQQPILDKIRAEIAEIQLIGYAKVDGKREIASRAVMQIIDKYKKESEEV